MTSTEVFRLELTMKSTVQLPRSTALQERTSYWNKINCSQIKLLPSAYRCEKTSEKERKQYVKGRCKIDAFPFLLQRLHCNPMHIHHASLIVFLHSCVVNIDPVSIGQWPWSQTLIFRRYFPQAGLPRKLNLTLSFIKTQKNFLETNIHVRL